MSTYTKFARMLLLLLIGAQMPVLVFAQSAPVLSQAKAIEIASTFCKSVGAPVTGTPTAQFPAPPRYKSQQDPHWQAHWRIEFGNDAEVEVIDATGVVSRYFNFLLSNQTSQPGTPVAKPMSETQALQRANAVLKASGQGDELEAPTTTFQQMNHTADGQEWIVIWQRQFQNIPYRDQQATLLLQADTGDVQAFSIAFHTPAPKAGPGSVTTVQAQSTGKAQMAGLGKAYTASKTPQLEVVQPNTYWQAGGTLDPQAGVSKVAWICFYTLADRGNEIAYEVWIDSTTGKVIGGDVSGSKKSARAASTPEKTQASTTSKLAVNPASSFGTTQNKQPLSIYTRFAGTFLLMIVAAQLPVLVFAESAPVLSQTKAIEIASSFCKSVGAPVTGTPTTQFPASPRYKDQPDTFWQARWRIKYGDGTEIDVVDATAVVAFYSNYSRSHQTSKPGTPVAKPMSKEQALQRANLVLQASALKGELEAPVATLKQSTYYVSWKRQYQNIPYRYQMAHVQLQPDTGDVLAFNIIFRSPPPKAGPGSITSVQAQTTGVAQMATVGKQYTVSTAPKLTVVQPNTFWQAGGTDTPQAGVSKVAWVCHYPLADQSRAWYEVWVDSTSGKVIGGELNGSR